jgi:hypothetical protein
MLKVKAKSGVKVSGPDKVLPVGRFISKTKAVGLSRKKHAISLG